LHVLNKLICRKTVSGMDFLQAQIVEKAKTVGEKKTSSNGPMGQLVNGPMQLGITNGE